MKPDSSNPFSTEPNGSTGQPENPFEQAARRAQLEESDQRTSTRLPERRDQEEEPPSPFSIDLDPEPEAAETPPIRITEPAEGFATPEKVVGQDPFVMPAPFEEAAVKPSVKASVASNPTPAPQAVEERQLVLRAIFGVAHDLDRAEILKRASSLPGIVSVQELGRAERAAFSVLRDGMKRMRHSVELELVSKEGTVELIHDQEATLVILHEGEYRPGVREILTIVAREIPRID